MTISDKATITIQEVVTLRLEGHEPIPDMRKVSEWNGMWELRSPSGQIAIVMAESGFGAIFAKLLSQPLTDARVVSISPSLLKPVKEA